MDSAVGRVSGAVATGACAHPLHKRVRELTPDFTFASLCEHGEVEASANRNLYFKTKVGIASVWYRGGLLCFMVW